MRIILVSAALTAMALMSGCGGEKKSEEAGGPIGKPARRAGLWEQTATIEGQPPQLIRICAAPSVEGTLPWWGRVVQDGQCKDIKGVKVADGSWDFEARCDMGPGGKSGIKGKGTGDFNSDYTVTVQMNTAGAAAPQLNGPRKLSNHFVWKGECPADWKAGDVEVPGGTRVNYDPAEVASELARAQAALKAQETQPPQ